MSNVLKQAEAAFEQGNWGLLHQCLQQLLIDRSIEALPNDIFERVLDLAIAILEAGDFQDRWDVVKLLPAFGDRAIDSLISLIQDDEADLDAHWFAARALGSYSHPKAVGALLDLLQAAEDDELRSIAAEALAHMGSPVIAALTAMLAQDETRLFAVRSLATIRQTETIDPLLTVVHDSNATVRAIAIGALGSFHDPRILPVLIQSLHDEKVTVRQVAVEALGFYNNAALQLDLVPLLSECLQDQDSAVCHEAAIALGRLGTDAATDVLCDALTSPLTPAQLQTDIVWALYRIGTINALDHLHQALHPFDQPALLPLYHTLILAIGRWETVKAQPKAAQILVDALKAPLVAEQPMLRKAIVNGLGALKQSNTLETLIHLLADEEMSVRLHAIAALKAVDSTTAHQHLEILVSHPDVPKALKQGAAIALQEW